MSLTDFYSELLVEYSNDKTNYGELSPADIAEELLNPLCGDRVGITAKIDNSLLKEINHNGQGCAISQASAAILAEHLRGKSISEAKELIGIFYQMILHPDELQEGDLEKIGDAKILAGIAKLPGRHRCALLAWENLKVGIEKNC